MAGNDIEQELARIAEKKQPQSSSTQLGGFNISGISDSTIHIGGSISTDVKAGGDIVGRDKITRQTLTDPNSAQAQLEAALAKWQTELEAKIATLSDLDDDEKEELKEKAIKVEQEVAKGEEANIGKIERLLNIMSSMAPDIIEVTAKTLQNPFAGVGLVLEKINDKIKLERVE